MLYLQGILLDFLIRLIELAWADKHGGVEKLQHGALRTPEDLLPAATAICCFLFLRVAERKEAGGEAGRQRFARDLHVQRQGYRLTVRRRRQRVAHRHRCVQHRAGLQTMHRRGCVGAWARATLWNSEGRHSGEQEVYMVAPLQALKMHIDGVEATRFSRREAKHPAATHTHCGDKTMAPVCQWQPQRADETVLHTPSERCSCMTPALSTGALWCTFRAEYLDRLGQRVLVGKAAVQPCHELTRPHRGRPSGRCATRVSPDSAYSLRSGKRRP